MTHAECQQRYWAKFPPGEKARRDREYNMKNAEKIKIQRARPYQKNKVDVLEKQKHYYEEHREEIRQKQSAYYLSHKDEAIARAREWEAANPERRRELVNRRAAAHRDQKNAASIRYRKEKPLKYLFNLAKKRARKRGMEFTISVADLSLPAFCPLLDILIDPFSETVDCRPSIDRIDNNKGYIPGNVMIVSQRANRIKSDATVDEMLTVVRNLLRIVGRDE